MPDLPQNTLSAPEPAYHPRVLTSRQRVAGSVLGAVSGGVAGWLAALVGGAHGVMLWSVVAGLAALAAVFGYRHGYSVVGAIVAAFTEAGAGR
jgi:hypothetical protein